MAGRPSNVITYFIVVWSICQITETVYMKFDKLDCEVNNEDFASFEECSLTKFSLHNVSLNVRIKLHKLPISDVKLHVQLFQKSESPRGDYQPYLYNSTLDFCRFMKSPNRWMFLKIVWDAIMPAANLNHTCPVNHDIIIKDLSLTMDSFKLVSFPVNDYLLRLKFIVYKVYWIEVRSYVNIYN